MCTTNLPRRPPCAASAGPLFCSNTATVASQTCFFCCARIPILRRVRWRAQPSATKERYGCGPPPAGAHRPFVRIHRNYLFYGNTATVAPRAYFFCLARKSRQKDALRNDLWRLRADSFQHPLRAQKYSFTDSFQFRQMYYTQKSSASSNFDSAHFRNTRPIAILHSMLNIYKKRTGRTESSAPTNIWHHRRMRRWPVISTAWCFAISLRGNCSPWERCLHAGGAVV